MKSIEEVARDLGLRAEDVIPFGAGKAKLSPVALNRNQPGRLILVSAITPTPAGEGKTTVAIALAQGLAATGRRACVALREPSLGPIFGRKGGATGGGRAALTPSADINLHFTGDFHAVTSAHNLLAAMLDNHLHQGNRLRIDTRRVLWRRVLDVNDRALREIVVGLGGRGNGVPRESGFDITAASEIMAALCLATDPDDLRHRLGRMVLAFSEAGEPITATDLGAVGAMLVLLKDALLPNLVQTNEGVPALVHGGPFANIAHGCSSVIATTLALAHAEWTVTEAGFGFDLGGEKFFDLASVPAHLDTAAVVLVASIRALKRHGRADAASLDRPDPDAVQRGLPNLVKQIENVHAFGNGPVVALNRFATDSDAEIAVVRTACQHLRAPFAVCDGYARGGEGAIDLAEQVVQHATDRARPFSPLYDYAAPAPSKLETIASTLYGADSVVWSRSAREDLELARSCGCEHLPLCVAKTPASLSDDPTKLGRPRGFSVTVDRLVIAAGAGYLVPILGSVRRMPGLPHEPQAEHIDLQDGRIVGV